MHNTSNNQKRSASAGTTTRRASRRPQWNDYLTDHDKFKLPEEDYLKKKQLYVSKNNILCDAYQPPKQKSIKASLSELKSRSAPSTPANSSSKNSKYSLPHDDYDENNEEIEGNFNSLDLLKLESDDEQSMQQTPTSTRKTKPTPKTKEMKKDTFASSPIASSTLQKKMVTSSPKSFSPTRQFFNKNETIEDSEVQEMYTEIRSLIHELRYYEELAGKRSILNINEIEETFPDILEDDLDTSSLTQKRVIKFLVQLVCQTMTHLLKTEVDSQRMQTQLNTVTSQVEEMMRFMNGKASVPLLDNRFLSSERLVPNTTTSTLPQYDNENHENLKIKQTLQVIKANQNHIMDIQSKPVDHTFKEEYDEDKLPFSRLEEILNRPTSEVINDVEHLIEYSKQIGSSEAFRAFDAMNNLSSTDQRLAYNHNNLENFSPAQPQVQQAPQTPPTTMTNATMGAGQLANLELQQRSAQLSVASNNNNNIMAPNSFASTSDYLFAHLTPPVQPKNVVSNTPTRSPIDAQFSTPKMNYLMPSQPFSGLNTQDLNQIETLPVTEESFDSTIDRLAYKFSEHEFIDKSSYQSQLQYHHPIEQTTITLTPNKKSVYNPKVEEALSMVDPKQNVPKPQSAPAHPYSSNKALHPTASVSTIKAKIVSNSYTSSAPSSAFLEASPTVMTLFPNTPTRKVYDATSGCF